jgi:hypothetical protein
MTLMKTIVRRIAADIRQTYIALLILLLYWGIAQWIFHTMCPWAILTGRSCPACGLTRAGIFLLTAQFAKAWQMNPSIYLWAPYLIYLCLWRYVLGKRAALAMPGAIVVGLGTIGIFLYRTFGIF